MKEGSEMPRRGQIAKRDVLPDPLYNSKLVTRLINNIMLDGKKGVAQKIVYGAFDIVKEKTGNDPLETFEAAMENVMPVLEVKARRIGGATSVVLIITGSTMIANVRTPAIREYPHALAITKARKPKRPYTMDGIPAKVSLVTRIIFTNLLPFFAYSTRYIAENTPTGTAISSVRKVR